MTKYLEIACEQLGIDQDSVIKHRQEGDDYVIIADLGIAGCPMYRIPLSQLVEPVPVSVPAPPEEISEEVPLRLKPELEKLSYNNLAPLRLKPELRKLSYNELRKAARKAGINTKGMKKADIIAALEGEW